MLQRRDFLKNAALLGLMPVMDMPLFSMPPKSQLRIAACDWSLGKSSDPAAFSIAKEIGLSGVMVNMGGIGNDFHLRQEAVQQEYLKQSKNTGVAISSLALAELNNIPFKSDPRTIEWVWDSVTVAKNLGVSVVLLAFFSNNDLRNDPAGQEEVVQRLRKIMPHAEKMGITLGIESYLNAQEHLSIMNKVNSPNLKVYYDFRNTADAGFNTIEEFLKLGKDNICELHMKENGQLLGEGSIDWPGVFRAIRTSGYIGDGWMQIEGALPDGASLIPAYKKNKTYLASLLKSGK